MARKKNKLDIVYQPVHRCGECGHATFDKKFENLDVYGRPTLVSCKFFEYKRIVSEMACKEFKMI